MSTKEKKWEEIHDKFYITSNGDGALRTPKRNQQSDFLPFEAYRMTLWNEKYNNRIIISLLENFEDLDIEEELKEEELPQKVLEQLLEVELPKSDKIKSHKYTKYHTLYANPELMIKYAEYLPERIKFVPFYNQGTELNGFTPAPKAIDDVYVPIQEDGTTNASINNTNFWKLVGHEDGHTNPLSDNTEDGLRALRGEQTRTYAGWKQLLSDMSSISKHYPGCCA